MKKQFVSGGAESCTWASSHPNVLPAPDPENNGVLLSLGFAMFYNGFFGMCFGICE